MFKIGEGDIELTCDMLSAFKVNGLKVRGHKVTWYFVHSCITYLSLVCESKFVSVCMSVYFTVLATKNGE